MFAQMHVSLSLLPLPSCTIETVHTSLQWNNLQGHYFCASFQNGGEERAFPLADQRLTFTDRGCLAEPTLLGQT